MSGVFQYSIIRFRPFADTGEFANIGVIVLDVAADMMTFELAPKRFGRIHSFFGAEAHAAFGSAIDHLRLELGRYEGFMALIADRSAKVLFEELTRTRESSILFSPARSILMDASVDYVAKKLFARFVKREHQENAEQELTKDIRRAFKHFGLKEYKTFRIDDELVPVTFPLATKDHDFRAIKPLAFSQKNSLNIFDYGAHWRRRFEYLLNKGKLKEHGVLIAVEPPQDDSESNLVEAYELAQAELKTLPFDVVVGELGGEVNPAIIDFAMQGRSAIRRDWH